MKNCDGKMSGMSKGMKGMKMGYGGKSAMGGKAAKSTAKKTTARRK